MFGSELNALTTNPLSDKRFGRVDKELAKQGRAYF
jgi:hypothetical protein